MKEERMDRRGKRRKETCTEYEQEVQTMYMPLHSHQLYHCHWQYTKLMKATY